MNRVARLFFQSVMNYIHLAIFIIIAIVMLSIFFSFWVSEKADNDAKAINLSGSMRMQTYKVGLSLHTDPDRTPRLVQQLDTKWGDPLFKKLLIEAENEELSTLFDKAFQHWTLVLKPVVLAELESPTKLSDSSSKEIQEKIDAQVSLTDELVNRFQDIAEEKIRELRTIQLITLTITTLVGSMIFYLLRNRVEMPLKSLTEAARKMSQGKFDQDIPVTSHDELSELARAFNQMRQSIQKAWQELEKKVQDRTLALKRNNATVNFLYETAQATINRDDHELDFISLAEELNRILENQNVEICLFTNQGETPYQRTISEDCNTKCIETDCDDCRSDDVDETIAIRLDHHYPITYQEQRFGVLTAHSPISQPLEGWQDNLLKSCADQIAIALSLKENLNNEYRLAMLRERTVIARELHDSLAQSLSYLQIQVSRLQKGMKSNRSDIQEEATQELKEGLSSAYRHLRELLTTFRLKLDGEGLHNTVNQMVEQLGDQTDIDIELEYGLSDVPLSPNEEIHLMQILREASRNAIYHSGGSTLNLKLEQQANSTIAVTIDDNGKGLPENSEKLNHYGLAIMQERASQLGGTLSISNNAAGGARVSLVFKPEYIREIA